jgi:alkaline phosphatase D
LGAALAFADGCAHSPGERRAERRDLYPQGVASGDPASDSVILWTRRPPTEASAAPRLTAEIASDRSFRRIVARATAELSEAADWTCRILVAGLEPRREYWYRFFDEYGFASRVGRTLTAPADDDARPVRFSFVSCQDPTQGALNAYRRMIFEDERAPPEERLFFVLHFGDFIYEVVWYPEDQPDGVLQGRRLRDLVRYPHGEKMRNFHLPVSLEDYRTAYRAYLQDPDLQDARARWPFVAVWDNHEFSWQGWQSQQAFGAVVRPAQTKKVAANQAWFEYQPARVVKSGGSSLDRFEAPNVRDAPIETFDALGLGTEPNNLAAVRSLRIYRTLRLGRNAEIILTDNHSFRSPPPNADDFTPDAFRWMNPQEAMEILDSGRAYNDGRPPDTIRYGDDEKPNPAKNAPPQSMLGAEQKAWFLDRLKQTTAPWKIWGHSFGTLDWRTDIQNLPSGIAAAAWPGMGYGWFNGGFFLERAEILDTVRDEGIAGFAVIAGDKHSFWAGLLSKTLPPRAFEPQGVEFITGSVSAPGLFEVAEQRIPKDDKLRALFLHDRADGSVASAMNVTMRHGVRSALKLAERGDIAAALAERNPDVAPHIRFADLGGHGYATVRVSERLLETEFVCIPRPLERSEANDGGPLLYRVRHSVPLWAPGEAPEMRQEILEGEAPLGN